MMRLNITKIINTKGIIGRWEEVKYHRKKPVHLHPCDHSCPRNSRFRQCNVNLLLLINSFIMNRLQTLLLPVFVDA